MTTKQVKDESTDMSVLVRRFNNRDIEALGTVYNLLYENLYYYTSKLYEDTNMYPADIINDVFLKVWQTPRYDFESLPDIKGYLLVAIKNSRRSLSAHIKHVDIYNERVLSSGESFKTEIIEADIFTIFHQALKLLPEDSAEILELFLQGYKTEEIAEKLGKTKQTIYNKKAEAISELKKKIHKDSILFLLPFL